VARATFYGRQAPGEDSGTGLLLCRLIDEEYTRRPFYGSRWMVVHLAHHGHRVNRKRVQRLMRQLGLAGSAPAPVTG
jgi:putative transposase